MANHAKAKHHHGKAGACLDAGDTKGAARHMGHALAALRNASSEGAEPADEMAAEPSPAPPTIRARLKGMKK